MDGHAIRSTPNQKDEVMRGVIIAHPSQKLALQLKRAVTDCGIAVLAVCSKGSSVLQLAQPLTEAVILCPLILPDMPAHHLAESLAVSFDIIALSGTSESYSGCGNLFLLNLPLNKSDFHALLFSLCSQTVLRDNKPTVKAQNDTLDAAKKLLMQTRHMSESQAHRYLQRAAMNRGLKMTDLAERLLAETGTSI